MHYHKNTLLYNTWLKREICLISQFWFWFTVKWFLKPPSKKKKARMTINHLIPKSFCPIKSGYTAKLRRTTQILSPYQLRMTLASSPSSSSIRNFETTVNASKTMTGHRIEEPRRSTYCWLVFTRHTLFIFCFPLLSKNGCELISKTKHDYYVKWSLMRSYFFHNQTPHGSSSHLAAQVVSAVLETSSGGQWTGTEWEVWQN